MTLTEYSMGIIRHVPHSAHFHLSDVKRKITLYGLYYYDQKRVISGQYGSLGKKLAKIGYFHESGFESSIEEEISFSNI